MERSWLIRLYRSLLNLYPRRFSEEFAEEMEGIFSDLLDETLTLPRLDLAKFLCIELFHLPGEALHQHLKIRRKKGTDSEPHPDGWDGPASRREVFVAMGVFILPAVTIWFNYGLNISTGWLAGLMGILFFYGVYRGFPRWSLPYLGLALSALSFMFIFQWAADLVAPAVIARLAIAGHNQSTHLLLQAFWAGLMWLSLFFLVFIAIGFLAIFRRFRTLFWKVRQDWTLVSYILYAGAMFMLFLTFNQYRYEKPYAVASTFCLMSGAWLYMRSSKRWKRALSLLIGLTLAMWTAAAGLWSGGVWLNLGNLQSWGSSENERWFEGFRAILAWGWMVIAICAPALLRFLPRFGTRQQSEPG
jgi:hypothetical protein